MEKYGFHVWLFRRDCFIETDRTKRTNALAEEFLNKIKSALGLQFETTPNDIALMRAKMLPCKAKMTVFPNGKKTVVFTGTKPDAWFVCGSESSEDPYKDPTLVLILKSKFVEEEAYL